jgi:hypothetical protein
VCFGDEFPFCLRATLGYSAQQATNNNNDTSTTATTTTESNATFIVRGFTTTVIRNGETYTHPLVVINAFIQDAVTGQNATVADAFSNYGVPLIGGSCEIPATGFTTCQILSHSLPYVPAGHPYKVTVFVTGPSALPCLSEPCPPNTIAHSWPMEAPPSPPIIVPAGTWGVTSNSSTSLQASTTTASTISSNPGYCDGGMNTTLNTVPKPTVYVKVVTDQGKVITNGSLVVDQLENMTNGYETSGYCIALSDVQETGYVRLADLNQSGSNVTSITGGYYNVTLVAGLGNQGPWYMATIPSIQISPYSVVYVTVSVPSGVVTIVTSSEGSSAVTTTTTSATTTKVNAP